MQSKTQPVAEDCPLFTSRHAHHSAAWSIEGFSLPLFCVACATERLEGKGELSVHVRKVLSEFQALLNTSGGEGGGCRLTEVLCGEQRVLEHLCGLLFGEEPWQRYRSTYATQRQSINFCLIVEN